MKHITPVFIGAGIILLCGCGPQVRRAVEGPICPGKPTIAQAVQALALQRQNLGPFEATAEGVISWTDEKGKERDERIGTGTLAFVPPDKVYFKGSLGFKEARFGTNENEFWLRIKFELDTYWWGLRQTAHECGAALLFDPAAIAEALGIVDVTEQWQLFYRDGFDILSFHQDGQISKRVYVNACDYRVERVEYFNTEGMQQVSIELGDYTTGENGLMVPSEIRAASYNAQGLEESAVDFSLKNVRPLTPERQKPKLFVRPERDGYGKLLRLNDNCEFIEESP